MYITVAFAFDTNRQDADSSWNLSGNDGLSNGGHSRHQRVETTFQTFSPTSTGHGRKRTIQHTYDSAM